MNKSIYTYTPTKIKCKTQTLTNLVAGQVLITRRAATAAEKLHYSRGRSSNSSLGPDRLYKVGPVDNA